MKKAFAMVLAVVMMCFSGCGVIAKDNKYVDEQSKRIMKCFDERDTEALKAMFCTGSQEYYDLDTQIENAFTKYEGKSTSYSVADKSSAGGRDSGEVVDKHFIPHINNINTDDNKTYSMGYCVFEVYKYNNDMVGIGVLTIYDGEENELATIGGYDWV